MDLCIGDKTGNISVWKLYETQDLEWKHQSMKIVLDIRLKTLKYGNYMRHKALTGNIEV